jgi:hypothetical protein
MTYEKEIQSSHPIIHDSKLSLEADAMAMRLVGERFDKRELVDLVRWLIMDKSKTVYSDL